MTHTHAHDENNTPNEHLPQTLNNARRYTRCGFCFGPFFISHILQLTPRVNPNSVALVKNFYCVEYTRCGFVFFSFFSRIIKPLPHKLSAEPRGFGLTRGKLLRRRVHQVRRLPPPTPQAPRYIQGSSPQTPKGTLGSAPCACVLVSPLYYKPSVDSFFLFCISLISYNSHHTS